MSGVEYGIRFYRNAQWANRFTRAGIDKPQGMVISPYRSINREVMATGVEHLNAEMPEQDCELMIFKNGLAL